MPPLSDTSNIVRRAAVAAVLLSGMIAAMFLLDGSASVFRSAEQAPSSPYAEHIRTSGGAAAYAAFAEEVEPFSAARQHSKAHEFGAALYATEGIEGLRVCDSRFSYGCFHEFLGRAIAEHGLGFVPELNQGCIEALVKSPLSCQHGVGHGILAYLGYDEDALRSALDECRDLPHNDPIGGCYGGVFMEYNLQIMLGVDARLRQPEESKDLYEPCSSLPEEYAPSCIFWQPQWWHSALFNGASTTEAFATMGEHCAVIAGGSPSLSRTCFEGIGNIVTPAAQFDAARSAQLCDSVSTEPLERLYCRSLAANSLSGGGAGVKGKGEAICDGLEGEYRSYCLAYARNEANILQVLPTPIR